MFHTTNFVFCWDSKTNIRQEIYPAYKQTRRDKEKTDEELAYDIEFRRQIKKLRRVYLPLIGCSNIFCQKGYESDDIIASLCLNEFDGYSIIIISADHDMYQCLSPVVSMYNPQQKKMMTVQKFERQYGIKPHQWVRVKCLAGCTSDNITGIAGIGEKTAIKYLTHQLKETTKAYQKIESCYNMVIKHNTKFVQLPFKGTKTFKIKENNYNDAGWIAVCKKLGLKSIEKRNPFMSIKKRKLKDNEERDIVTENQFEVY